MGFSEVILVGVDHNYVTQGAANQAVVSQGDDPNHFASNYFGKGFKWQLPDLAGSERGYPRAREAYSRGWSAHSGCHCGRQADHFSQGRLPVAVLMGHIGFDMFNSKGLVTFE